MKKIILIGFCILIFPFVDSYFASYFDYYMDYFESIRCDYDFNENFNFTVDFYSIHDEKIDCELYNLRFNSLRYDGELSVDAECFFWSNKYNYYVVHSYVTGYGVRNILLNESLNILYLTEITSQCVDNYDFGKVTYHEKVLGYTNWY